MIRTQVYLPRQLYNHIRVVAQREQRPAAEVIRELLEKSLAIKGKSTNVGEALMKLASVGAKGPRDLSKKIDSYLYEK